ncbi:MAG: transposase [Alphaproteobacteria bacterium]|nr:transposase [Alphaproteobacteria bacterium]
MIAKLPRPRRFYTPEQGKEFIDNWQNSGLSQIAFCQQHELTPSAFDRWRTKITRLESGLSFPKTTPITSSHSALLVTGKLELIAEKKHWSPCYYTLAQWKEIIDPNQWKELIKEWEKSGLARAIYCMKKGLNPSSFYRWEQMLKLVEPHSQVSEHPQKQKSSSASSFKEHFIPVMLKPSPLTNSSNVNPKIEVTLSQGHHLSIQGPFDRGNLIALLTSILRR